MAAPSIIPKAKVNLSLKKTFTIGSVDEPLLQLKKFDESVEFKNFYINGKTMYCCGVTGAICEFTQYYPQKIRLLSEASSTSPIQEINIKCSYYTLHKNWLIEFFCEPFNKPEVGQRYKVNMIKTQFNSNGKLLDRKYEPIEFEYAVVPQIYQVNGCVIISNKCSFGCISNAEVFKGHRGWTYNDHGRLPSPPGNKAQTVIYNLAKSTTHTIPGIADSKIVADRFVIVYCGDYFTVVDIKTGNEKMKVVTGIYQQYIQNKLCIILKKIIVPVESADNTINSIQVLEYDTNSNCIITQYDVAEDDNYSPEPDECMVCYHDADRKYVLLPCAHNQYCGDCIKKLVEFKSNCARCNGEAQSFVKIKE